MHTRVRLPVVMSDPGFAEPLSALLHLAGAMVFARLGISLVRQGRGDLQRSMSLAVFVFSGVLLLAVSGIYHLSAPNSEFREVLRRLDHAAIFVLIAGSFTPIHAILFRGPWRWRMLAGIWALALAGLTVKTLYFATIPEVFGLAMYLGFGWLGLVSWVALVRRFGFRFAHPVLWGALAYTLGALTDYLRWPVPIPGLVGAHELFHLAVLAGLAFHWMFIRSFASPEMPAPGRVERRGHTLPIATA
jgi:channel protein (hemolysin III family)